MKGQKYIGDSRLKRHENQFRLPYQPELRGGLGGGEAIVDYFDRLLFQGSLNKTQRQMLMDFANTNVAMRPKALNPASPDYLKKVQNWSD